MDRADGFRARPSCRGRVELGVSWQRRWITRSEIDERQARVLGGVISRDACGRREPGLLRRLFDARAPDGSNFQLW